MSYALVMSEMGVLAHPVEEENGLQKSQASTTASAYIRGDAEVNTLRSGISSPCRKCGAQPGAWCTGARNRILAYNHHERRQAGKAAADALVVARGRATMVHPRAVARGRG